MGRLIPGVIFVLMGGIPLVLGLMARDEIRSGGSAAVLARYGTSVIAMRRANASRDGDVVDRLERLARLRRDGDISDAEYEAAKSAVLGSAGGSA